MSWKQTRSPTSDALKQKLLTTIASRARSMPHRDNRRLIPSLQPREISLLRSATPDYFGWERLFTAAEGLGFEVELRVVEREAA
jgi:hypothetical protein